MTVQRQTVLEVIRASEEHMTANEVFDAARRLSPKISFATVYNSLNYLRKEKLIGEVRFGAGATLYDRKLSRHDHAICDDCGKLADLEMPLPNELLREACRRSKFKAAMIELTLRGLCPQCSKKGSDRSKENRNQQTVNPKDFKQS